MTSKKVFATLASFILVSSLLIVSVSAEDKDDEDMDLVIGPAGEIVFKSKDKKGKGDTIVLAGSGGGRRRRRSPRMIPIDENEETPFE